MTHYEHHYIPDLHLLQVIETVDGPQSERAGNVETAAQRHHGDFPSSWGVPEGAPYSETRARWIAENVATTQMEAWIRGGNAKAALAIARALAKAD